MQKYGRVLWFVFSLVLLAVSGFCVHSANVAYHELLDSPHSGFATLALQGIFIEYALTTLLGSVLFLTGIVSALVSGISLLRLKK